MSKEFVFILEFFDLKSVQCTYIFNQIFSKVINYYLDWLTQYVSTQLFDINAVLLMTVINDENKRYMHKNKLTVLDFFFEKISILLWPRFSNLFDIQIDSIKNTNIAALKLYNQCSVYQASVNFADLLRSLFLVGPYLSQDMLSIKMSSLKTVFLEFLKKVSVNHFAEDKDKKSFIINNIDYIIQTFTQRQ